MPGRFLGRTQAIVLVSLLFFVASVAVLPFDKLLAHPDNLQALPGDLKRVISLSEIFAHGFGIILIATAVWLLARDRSRFIPRIVLCAVWPAIVVHGIKLLFGRSRPICYFDEESEIHFPANIADTFVGWMPRDEFNTIYHLQSFPSAHTATVWGLAIGLSFAFPKGKWLYVAVAALASVQRVTSYAHWPSDVLFGAGIGILFGGSLACHWGVGRWLGSFEANRALKQADEQTDEQTAIDSRKKAG